MENKDFRYNFTLAGNIMDHNFHKCAACLNYMKEVNPNNVNICVMELFET